MSTPNASESEEASGRWTDAESLFLLDKYFEYLKDVGPGRTFRDKKHMYEKICLELKTEHGRTFTAQQAKSRYETLKNNYKTGKQANKQSGNSPVKVPYKDQFEKISFIDNSIYPQVIRNAKGVLTGKGSTIKNKDKNCQDPFDDMTEDVDKNIKFMKRSRVNTVIWQFFLV